MHHALIREMDELGLINASELETFHPKVRDSDSIAVLRDPNSEVLILSSIEQVSSDYYQNKAETGVYSNEWNIKRTPKLPDNIRRAESFRWYIQDKDWLDVGCGLGGALEELAPYSNSAKGLEPAQERAEITRNKGFDVVSSVHDIQDNSLDVISLFHVLEHIPAQKEILIELRRKLREGGKLIVEVPHARDAMFTQYNHLPFKDFTFWSEHLVLHTRRSLSRYLEIAGYMDIAVTGLQRYPIANHLYWLAHGKPGGHDKWSAFTSPALEREYSNLLCAQDKTDTLVAIGTK